jgi:uncharacterized circularly permuted ATP-grasp superfamily protein
MLTKDSQWPHVHPDWGLKVVHPQDLQIRDRQLWHIGPQGSFRIQTVLNLTGQETTDPLEIRPHDHAGIAGLFDVLRQQALTWVNPPGLGFLDSAAWHGFWPALTRQILQEDLLLPSLTTWWMGERDIHPLAWQTLAQALLTPTFPDDGLRPSRHPVQVDFNRPGELDAWRSVLVHEAEDWVMQQPTPLTNQRSMLLLIGPDGISHMMSLHGQPLDETGIRP